MIPDQCNYTFCKIKNSQLIHLFCINSWHLNNTLYLSLIVLETFGLIYMRPAVLFWYPLVIDLFDQLFEERSKRERYVFLDVFTLVVFTLVVFTLVVFLVYCCFFRDYSQVIFISRMPTGGELEMANTYTKWLMPTRTPAYTTKNGRKIPL